MNREHRLEMIAHFEEYKGRPSSRFRCTPAEGAESTGSELRTAY